MLSYSESFAPISDPGYTLSCFRAAGNGVLPPNRSSNKVRLRLRGPP